MEPQLEIDGPKAQRRSLLLSYTRRELPGWGKLYERFGGSDDARWRDAGMATVRGKLHGYEMELDLANWSERLTWFLARYHDLPLQQALQRVLRAGDCFVDVGANLCMLSMLASASVGERGRVLALEPNPQLIGRGQRMIARNRIANLELVHTAVGDCHGQVELHEFAGHSGWGSLSPEGPEGTAVTATWTVECRTADDLLRDDDPARPLVVKIDVEGHEVPVLRGMQDTITRRWPLMFLEVVDDHLRRAGFSAAELRAELEQHGYRGYVVEGVRRRLLGHDFELQPLQPDEQRQVDVLFVPPEGPLAERVRALLP